MCKLQIPESKLNVILGDEDKHAVHGDCPPAGGRSAECSHGQSQCLSQHHLRESGLLGGCVLKLSTIRHFLYPVSGRCTRYNRRISCRKSDFRKGRIFGWICKYATGLFLTWLVNLLPVHSLTVCFKVINKESALFPKILFFKYK